MSSPLPMLKMSSMTVQRLLDRTAKPEIGFALFLVAAVAVSLVEYLKGAKPSYGENYFHYNNYVIFKTSLFNLIDQINLYAPHPDQYFDLYKYSPSFPLLMAVMARLPDWLGLTIWNALNTLPLFAAIMLLPGLSSRIRVTFCWLVAVDVMTSLHNAQSNGLMAALFILAFVLMERRRLVWAALCIVLMVYIKLFGLVALMLFALYPDKFKSALSVVGWTILIGIAPLLIVDAGYLIDQYQEWLRLLTTDHSENYGVSLLGLIESWTGFSPPKFLPLAAGAILLMAPLIKFSSYRSITFRLSLIASILIWVVIFNHKAESSTFIIASCGVALWYFAGARSMWHHILLVGSILLVTLSPTDFFPPCIRGEIIVPYKLKALPPVLIWSVIQYELWSGRRLRTAPSSQLS